VTAVDFHVQVADKMGYTCRLLRKAVARGSRLMVTGDANLLAQLEQDLWLFSATDFVPHCADSAPSRVRSRTPVVLADAAQPLQAADAQMILVNLGHPVPAGFEGFARVIEVVSQDDQDLQLARQRWRHYVRAGFSPVKYELGAAHP